MGLLAITFILFNLQCTHNSIRPSCFCCDHASLINKKPLKAVSAGKEKREGRSNEFNDLRIDRRELLNLRIVDFVLKCNDFVELGLLASQTSQVGWRRLSSSRILLLELLLGSWRLLLELLSSWGLIGGVNLIDFFLQ